MPSEDHWQDLVRDPAALLGVLFTHMPMGIALFDRELTLRAFNPTWAGYIERYGPPESRPIQAGLHLRDLLGAGADFDIWFRAVGERVLAGETVRRDAVELIYGDNIGWLDFVHAPVVEDNAVVGFMEVCADATERMLANERARHLAAIVDSSNDAVVGGALDGTVISWNPGAERLYGYTAEEVIGRSVLMLYTPGLLSMLPEVREKILHRESVEQFETQRVRKGGEVIDVAITYSPIIDSTGAVIGISSITRDITARKRAEKALQERESQYRGIFENSSDGLAVTAEGSGQLVAVNPAFCAMTGYTAEELLRLHWRDVVHPDDHQRIQEAEATGSGADFRVQVRLLDKDGTTLPVELHAVAFVYGGGPALLGVVRDVSAQVRAMETLEERVAERTAELSSLLEVSRTVASTLELERLAEVIFEQLNRFIVDYVGATFWIREDDTIVPVASTIDPGVAGTRQPLPGDVPPWSEMLQARPMVIDDVLVDSDIAQRYRELNPNLPPPSNLNVRSWAGVPMMVNERVTGMLAVSSAEPGFFTPRRVDLLEAIASQAAVAAENIRLLAEAQGRAALEERQRLARELHDSVSQALYGIALGAKTARALLDRNSPKASEPIDYVLSLADAGLAEMRALIFELRPESLAEEGLVAALEKQAAALRARHRLEVVASLPEEPDLPLPVEEAFYRIAQEALHNTVKHARATQVDLRLFSDDGWVTLEIRDDGLGFDPSGDFPGHLGLRSMSERAARVGAEFAIESAPGQGTRVTLRAPR